MLFWLLNLDFAATLAVPIVSELAGRIQISRALRSSVQINKALASSVQINKALIGTIEIEPFNTNKIF